MIAGWCIPINLLIGLEDPIEEDHRRGIKISDAISTKKAMAIDFKTSFILTPGPTSKGQRGGSGRFLPAVASAAPHCWAKN